MSTISAFVEAAYSKTCRAMIMLKAKIERKRDGGSLGEMFDPFRVSNSLFNCFGMIEFGVMS